MSCQIARPVFACNAGILQTSLELLDMGKDVHIVIDCCGSKCKLDMKVALMRLRDAGAFLTTTEAIIISMGPNSDHVSYPQISESMKNICRQHGRVYLSEI